MRTLGRICLAVTVLAILAAIWTPYMWPSIATAALALFTGASILGNEDKRDRAHNPNPDAWRIERSPAPNTTGRVWGYGKPGKDHE